MNFRSWLQNLRSALAPGRGQHRHGRPGSLRAASHRPYLEVLEDRLTPSFSSAVSYSVGTNPQAVATADFDNDGQVDLATANADGDTVSVRLGNGLGDFGAANHFAAGDRPVSLATADFNKDGILDLVTGTSDGTTDSVPNTLSVLIGMGNGVFQAPVQIATDPGWQFPSVAVADFNADANMDLVYITETVFDPPEMYVLLGDGRGGFAEAGWAAPAPNPMALAVADLNADGKPDVVTANYFSTVSVLLGNGDGTLNYDYSGSSDFATGLYPRSVAVGDFTGDGIPDVVTAGRTVDILPGRGDGTFAAPIHYSANGTGMTTVAAADFNADGKLDTVTADPATGTVSVLLGRGDGTLAPPIAHAAGSAPRAVAVGDFNGDGRPDVAGASTGSNAVFVLLNDGDWSSHITPRISITDVSKAEGKKGKTTLFTLTVTLSVAYDQPVTMSFRTVDGAATTSDGDYVAKSGTLTFAPGETTKTITIEVKGDSKREADETFYLDLFGLSTNALFTKNRGIATILNDD